MVGNKISQKIRNCKKKKNQNHNYGEISKGYRSQLKKAMSGQIWTCINKIYKVSSLYISRYLKYTQDILFATPWTVPCQASPSIRFSRQEYWSELPFPSPGDLPNPGIEPGSPALQADSLSSEPPGSSKLYKVILN